MKTATYFFTAVGVLFFNLASYCQKNDTIPSFIKGKQAVGVNLSDTAGPAKKNSAIRAGKHDSSDSPYKVDSLTRKRHNPRRATLYSTFLPGLGQVYNKKYWKVPIVYAAVGIPAYFYFDNKRWYEKCQFAIGVILSGDTTQATLLKVDPQLRPFVVGLEDNQIRSARNEYRKNEDYSVLFVLLFWGLQIVDATVDAHLKDFDISTNLSMRLRPSGMGAANGGMGGVSGNAFAGGGSAGNVQGLSLVFDLHKAKFKPIALP
jgi:hypothetical protein